MDTAHNRDVTKKLKEFELLNDSTTAGPNAPALFALASEQMGYVTTAQAQSLGYSRPLLSHYAKTGRFLRVQHGLYRLRDYPSSPHEEIMAAWLSIGKEQAVVSHESALVLLSLSDVVPNAIHLLVPRSRRGRRSTSGTHIHTTTHALGPDDVVIREGMRLTAPARTILDVAETGTASEQVIMAVEQAKRRGWVTDTSLLDRARERGPRVTALIAHGLQSA